MDHQPHKSESPTLPVQQTRICSSPAGLSAGGHLPAAGIDETLNESRASGWFDGFFGRIRSVFRSWDVDSNKG